MATVMRARARAERIATGGPTTCSWNCCTNTPTCQTAPVTLIAIIAAVAVITAIGLLVAVAAAVITAAAIILRLGGCRRNQRARSHRKCSAGHAERLEH